MRIPQAPPDLGDSLAQLSASRLAEVLLRAQEANDGRYLHWDDMRRRPAPVGLTHQEWWVGTKLRRRSQYKPLPLVDRHGQPFVVTVPEAAHALLHELTQRASGTMGAPTQVTNEESRNRYLVRNLMEEGITSSLLEGAATTRRQAKDMLAAGRPPTTEGERMVANNYTAMQHIIARGKVELTVEEVLDVHRTLTDGTMKHADESGRFRRADEVVEVVDVRDDTVLHSPPHADELPARMQAMCDFANGKTPSGFLHPVVRSVLLHFWLAYDHPFVDGNGRCARALFYWSMLRHDYWLCQYISISQVILRAPVKYGRAFLHTETDDNDITYFLLHQLNIVKQAVDDLHSHIEARLQDRREVELQLRLDTSFNERQLDLLGHALRHPDAEYDIAGHQTRNGVVYQTARTDLLGLADKQLLTKHKRGKTFIFRPASDLHDRLADLRP